MHDAPASEQIDAIIEKQPSWKAKLLHDIRAVILCAAPSVTEEIKWRMANRPEGLAVWTHNGIVCFAEIWKDNIKLIFSKGSHFENKTKLFNARLKSTEVRAVEFKEGDIVEKQTLAELVTHAVAYNDAKQTGSAAKS